MKKLIICCSLFSIFLASCGPNSEPEINVETAVAQLQEDLTVETAVADMKASLTAEAGGTLPPVPTETIAPTPTSTVCSLNQTCMAGGISLTISDVTTIGEIGKHWAADEGFIYLVIDVKIENLERDETPYNPIWFTATDSMGRKYIGNIFAPLPDLGMGVLKRGENVNGKVSYLVVMEGRGYTITYLPLDVFGDYLPIQIDIGY